MSRARKVVGGFGKGLGALKDGIKNKVFPNKNLEQTQKVKMTPNEIFTSLRANGINFFRSVKNFAGKTASFTKFLFFYTKDVGIPKFQKFTSETKENFLTWRTKFEQFKEDSKHHIAKVEASRKIVFAFIRKMLGQNQLVIPKRN